MIKKQNILQVPGAKPGVFYGYIIAIATFSIFLVVFGMRFTYGVFFTPMANDLGWSHATTSLAYSISMLMEGTFNIILGSVNDKYGPRVVITLSGILIAVGYCLIPLASSVWQFYLFYGGLIGIGTGGMFVPMVSTIARWFKVRRSLMTGIVLSGVGFGMLIMAPLANRFIESFGWRTTFLMMGIIILIIVTLSAQFLKRDPSTMGLLPYGDTAKAYNRKLPTEGQSLKQAFRKYQLWFIMFMLFFYGYNLLSISIHIVPDAIKLGVSATIAASILATLGGFQIVGRIGMGAMADYIGNKRVFVVAFIAGIISLIWLTFNSVTWAFFIFAIVFGVAQGGIASTQSPLVASLFGLKSHGLIFGVCGFFFTLGGALGPYVTGYIFDITGSYHLAFIICIGIGVLGLILTLLIRPLEGAPKGKVRF